METDRNLLFGLIAMQSDLIEMRQFVDACTLWGSRKDSAPNATVRLVRQRKRSIHQPPCATSSKRDDCTTSMTVAARHGCLGSTNCSTE